MTQPTLAFIGTGLMGEPMGLQLLRNDYSLTVYNRTATKLEPLVAEGAHVEDTALAAVKAADISVLMLSDAAAIEQLLLAEEVSLDGKILLNMSTIAPQEARHLVERFAERGADFVECPVLGSIPEASRGDLILMAGMSVAHFEQLQPLLKCLGKSPILVGDVGSASTLKLAMNQLIASMTQAFSLSLGLIRCEGVDVDTFMSVVRESALYAPTYDKKLQRMLDRDFEQPNFPVKHLQKDVDLFLQSASPHGLDSGMLHAMASTLATTVANGLADKDYSALYQTVHPD